MLGIIYLILAGILGYKASKILIEEERSFLLLTVSGLPCRLRLE